MTGLTLDTAQARELNRVVNDLLVQAEAGVVLLTDIGGNVLAQAPQRTDPQLQTVAALAAGAFVATRELARLTGETAFRSVSHEGEQTSLFVHSLGDDFLLVIAYQRTTTLGLVKLYARQTATELAPLLADLQRQTSTPSGFGLLTLDASNATVFALPQQNGAPIRSTRPPLRTG